LFACLVLKEFLRLDYRKLSALLADCPKLAAAIDLEREKVSGTFFWSAAWPDGAFEVEAADGAFRP
jgi:hypothetical protein